ncbi:helix-turn-helix domain-containing protein [uncultured Citricoccus sp.]|uniref:helix-turn-helix domain-containing protein n=1 Tax=uncultured Citricoccus sp. TaxID=614031 RepID=UPI002639C5A0|nr:helix-turn-helix domain-containing protein [uncultured Citricoccus sp.]
MLYYKSTDEGGQVSLHPQAPLWTDPNLGPLGSYRDLNGRQPVSQNMERHDEISELMRVGQGTVLRWINEHKLPVASVGSKIRRVFSEFRAWLLQADEIED